MAWTGLRSGLILAILLVTRVAFCQSGYPLKIKVEGMRSGSGHLAISVFPKSESKSFPGKADKAAEQIYVPLEGKTVIEVETRALPPGEYAVALLHDENSDKKLDTNFVGIPKEGFGFSQNPRVLVGPPRFSRAQIEHGEKVEEVAIKVRYML